VLFVFASIFKQEITMSDSGSGSDGCSSLVGCLGLIAIAFVCYSCVSRPEDFQKWVEGFPSFMTPTSTVPDEARRKAISYLQENSKVPFSNLEVYLDPSSDELLSVVVAFAKVRQSGGTDLERTQAVIQLENYGGSWKIAKASPFRAAKHQSTTTFSDIEVVENRTGKASVTLCSGKSEPSQRPIIYGEFQICFRAKVTVSENEILRFRFSGEKDWVYMVLSQDQNSQVRVLGNKLWKKSDGMKEIEFYTSDTEVGEQKPAFNYKFEYRVFTPTPPPTSTPGSTQTSP
jgi:hypothetical protein